jgi:large subunit ribosomal protein L5
MTNQKQRLQQKYEEEITAKLKEEFKIDNVMAVPKIVKIVINMGIGKSVNKNKDIKDVLSKDLALIAGQKPSVRQAKVSIAAFGLRAGMPVGLATTLRGARMYSFLDKLCAIVLPRLRDFRGVPKKGLDKSGNYTLGMGEHTIFPEIDPAKSAAPHGMEITIVTSGDNREQSERLLTLLGLPFEK